MRRGHCGPLFQDVKKDLPRHLFQHSVVLPVDRNGRRALDCMSPGETFEYVSQLSCGLVGRVLDEANRNWKFLVVLIVEDRSPDRARWMGVIETIGSKNGKEILRICNVREVGLLDPRHFREPIEQLSPVEPGPYIIFTPAAVMDYLAQYEAWLRDKYNPFFLENCLFLATDWEALRQLPFDLDGAQTIEIPSPSGVAVEIFECAASLGKVLNIIFGDLNNDMNIAGIAVVDSILIDETKTAIRFSCADEFLNISSGISASTLRLSDGRELGQSFRGGACAVCETPWYISLYLDRVFCCPTVSEFTHALANVDVTVEERTMLWLHVSAPERTLSLDELARGMRSGNASAVYLRYSMLASRIAHFVEFPLEHFDEGLHCIAVRADLLSCVVEERWQMRPELASALVELGWVSIRGEQYELSEPKKH